MRRVNKYKHKAAPKEHHNPFFRCPDCHGDNVYLVPPSCGDPGIYICMVCNKEITPESKNGRMESKSAKERS